LGYYTDRHHGARLRTATEIEEPVRRGILTVIRTRASDGSFGLAFPEYCPDGEGVTGTDTSAMESTIVAHRLYNLFERGAEIPTTFELLDLIEFSYEKIAKPIQGGYHSYYRHHHLSFDQAEGRAGFRAEINRIFERNGIAYELAESGQVERTAPEVLRELLAETLFQTEDTTLNELLEKARTKFLSRDAAIRKESLEALWDAWERLKSLELGKDKKESVGKLLDKVTAEPNFRELLELEARQLTDIGNKFMIRHAEVGKVAVDDDEQIDYLFHRLFSLIRLLLKKSNRGG
jgi:hypothetical protein